MPSRSIRRAAPSSSSLLALYIGGALALFGARVGTVRQGTTFDLVSREGALVLNNLLLSVILGIVLIGTLYPLVAAGVRRAAFGRAAVLQQGGGADRAGAGRRHGGGAAAALAARRGASACSSG